MKYLLDSDVLIDYFDGKAETVRVVDKYVREGMAVSTIVYMEALEGRLKLRSLIDATEEFNTLLASANVLEVSKEVAIVCAQIRRVLRLRGSRVRPRALDLLIAATAIEYNLTLVTRNRDDYHDIPGLTMVNV